LGDKVIQNEKKPVTRPSKKTKTRLIKLVSAILLVVIVLIFLLVPVVVSSEKGREIILAKINNSLQGRASFASLSMSWWKGIKVTDISFNDNAGQTFVEVKQIATKPHYGSIFMGSLSFGKTIIDEPSVKINLKGREPKKPQAFPAKAATGQKSQAIVLPIQKIDLVIRDGNLKVTSRETKAVELSRINSRLNLRPPGQKTNFDINMAVVAEGKETKVSVDGQIKPDKQTGWGLKGTSGDLTVEVNDLNLGSLGPVFELAGVEFEGKGSISANIKSEIEDGQIKDLHGAIEGKGIDVTLPKLKGDRLKSNALNVAVELNQKEQLINITRLEIQADWLKTQLSGTVPTTFASLAEFIKADSPYSLKGNLTCDVAMAMSQMPQTFGLRKGIEVTSGQLNANIQTLVDGGQKKLAGQVNLVGLAGTVDGKMIALSEPVRAETQISSDKTGTKFDKLDLSAAFAKISCTGTTNSINYDANINLAKLQSELGQFINIGSYELTGDVAGNGQISGDKNKIAVAGSLKYKDLGFTGKDGTRAFEPQGDVSFLLAAEPPKNIIGIDFIKANTGFGRLDVKDAIVPLNKDAAIPMSLAVSANVDLQKLQPFAVLFASFPKEMQIAGTADSNASVSSKKGIYNIVTDSTKIKNLKLSAPGQEPFIQDEILFVFDGDYNPTDNNWAVRKLQLTSPDIKIKGNFGKDVEGDKTKLQGQADFEYDWAAVSTIASGFWPKNLKLEGKRKDTISFTSEYPTGQTDKLLANLNTKRSKLGFERAEFMGLYFGPTEMDVQIQNGLLTIAPFSTTVNKGKLNFAGQADFKQKPSLFKIPKPLQIIQDVQINDEVAGSLLAKLNPIFVNAVDVTGVANFQCETLAVPISNGRKEDIEIAGTISLTQINMQPTGFLGTILSAIGTSRGQMMAINPTKFVVKNGYVTYDNMQLVIGNNPIDFSGSLPMNPEQTIENFKITLPYTLEGKSAKIGGESSGQRITLPVKGTLKNPQLDVGKLIKDQAVEKGLELLGGLLKK